MTRRERFQIYWFVIASCCVTVAINWAIGQQVDSPAQPRLRLRRDFDVLTFPNGSTWYLQNGSLQAIWAIPRDKHEDMGGVKTRIYGTGYQINLPFEVAEVIDALIQADIMELQQLRKINQRRVEMVPPGRVTPPN